VRRQDDGDRGGRGFFTNRHLAFLEEVRRNADNISISSTRQNAKKEKNESCNTGVVSLGDPQNQSANGTLKRGNPVAYIRAWEVYESCGNIPARGLRGTVLLPASRFHAIRNSPQ
jgi:hypothetical protein